MEPDYLFRTADWPLRSRRRRVRIGDLMVAVAMTAIGLSVIAVPDLTGVEKRTVGMVAVARLALQWAQWGLA